MQQVADEVFQFPVLELGKDYDDGECLALWGNGAPMAVVAHLRRQSDLVPEEHWPVFAGGRGKGLVVKYFARPLQECITEFIHVSMCAVFPHPNVLSCFPLICWDPKEQRVGHLMPMGRPLVKFVDGVMEYCEPRPNSAAAVLKDVFRGLAFLHSFGVVHGDLYIGNVIFHNGSWCVFDFGHSSSLKTLQHSVDPKAAHGATPKSPDAELAPSRILRFVQEIKQCCAGGEEQSVTALVAYLEIANQEAKSVTPADLFSRMGEDVGDLTATGYSDAWQFFVEPDDTKLHLEAMSLEKEYGPTKSTVLHLALQSTNGFERVKKVLAELKKRSDVHSLVKKRDAFGLTPLMILGTFPFGESDLGWTEVFNELLELGAGGANPAPDFSAVISEPAIAQCYCTHLGLRTRISEGLPSFSFYMIKAGALSGYLISLGLPIPEILQFLSTKGRLLNREISLDSVQSLVPEMLSLLFKRCDPLVLTKLFSIFPLHSIMPLLLSVWKTFSKLEQSDKDALVRMMMTGGATRQMNKMIDGGARPMNKALAGFSERLFTSANGTTDGYFFKGMPYQ